MATDALVLRLSKSNALKKSVRALRLYKAANLYRRCFPVVKQLPTGVTYRASSLESVPLARQMLEEGTTYPKAKLPAK